MSKIFLFMLTSLDGFFEGENHDLSWHHVDEEFNMFAAKQMQDIGLLLFGRRTYQLMESFWPHYEAEDPDNTIIKERMDMIPKIVFSKTLKNIKETENWRNVSLIHELDVEKIREIKKQEEKPIAVFGSSQLCVSLLKLALLDELRIMVNPVVLGSGTQLFSGLNEKINVQLFNTKVFNNGNILSYYRVNY